jgi:hypothetical protein
MVLESPQVVAIYALHGDQVTVEILAWHLVVAMLESHEVGQTMHDFCDRERAVFRIPLAVRSMFSGANVRAE